MRVPDGKRELVRDFSHGVPWLIQDSQVLAVTSKVQSQWNCWGLIRDLPDWQQRARSRPQDWDTDSVNSLGYCTSPREETKTIIRLDFLPPSLFPQQMRKRGSKVRWLKTQEMCCVRLAYKQRFSSPGRSSFLTLLLVVSCLRTPPLNHISHLEP